MGHLPNQHFALPILKGKVNRNENPRIRKSEESSNAAVLHGLVAFLIDAVPGQREVLVLTN